MRKKKRKFCKEIFTTRKGFLFTFIIIILTIILAYYALVFLFFNFFLELIISLLGIFVLLMTIFNNKIVLEDYDIVVYFGIIVYRIKYKNIKEIYKDNNFLIGFNSSYRKVGIKMHKTKNKLFDIFLSPIDRDGFIDKVNSKRVC